MDKNQVPIQFYLDLPSKLKLKHIADKDGRSISNYLRLLVRNAIDRSDRRGL